MIKDIKIEIDDVVGMEFGKNNALENPGIVVGKVSFSSETGQHEVWYNASIEHICSQEDREEYTSFVEFQTEDDEEEIEWDEIFPNEPGEFIQRDSYHLARKVEIFLWKWKERNIKNKEDLCYIGDWETIGQ